MRCPKCGSIVKLEGATELITCPCNFTRPKVWWDALQLDVNTEIKFDGAVVTEEEIPDELTGYCESPWGD